MEIIQLPRHIFLYNELRLWLDLAVIICLKIVTKEHLKLPQASKEGLRIYRPGLKMEEEETQGWMSWVWNWGGEADEETKEVKTGGRM